MRTQRHNQVYEFLVNDDFINFIIHPTPYLIQKWEDFFSQHPDKLAVANEAKSIILGESDIYFLPFYESSLMKNKIFKFIGLSSELN